MPGWTKATSYRWERGDYRMIEVQVGKRTRYCAQYNPERKYFGKAESWHDTPAEAAKWCEDHQRDGALNGQG